MATVVEELIIALRADGGQLRTELSRLLEQARKTGPEGEKALKPFSSALQRIGAEARAGLRPLSDYREELKRQEQQLTRTARQQDKTSAEYRQTVTELTNVKRELASVTIELRAQETLWDRLGGGLTRFGGALSLGVTAPLAVVGGVGLRSAQQLEVFGKTLETLIGDADKARNVFEELYEFDTQTTFAWPNLTKATTLLAAFNFEAEELLPTLGTLGDLAAGVNMNIDELAELYGKARVQGRMFAQDINQLQGRGIPIIQELAKQFGVTEDRVRSLVSEGRVGFEHIEQAFISLTSEGGKFFGLMAAQTDTSAGKLMALRKEFEQVSDLIGEALIPHFDALVQRGRDAVEWFVALDESTQSNIVNMGLFLAALGPGLVVVGQMVTAVQRLRTALITLRAAGLLSLGPAGWIALAITAGSGLALMLTGRKDSLDKAAEAARDALAGGDQEGLLGALKRLESFADRDMRDTLVGLQEEIRRTGEVTAETLAQVDATVLEMQAKPIRAEIAALQAQRDSLVERLSLIETPESFDPEATAAEIERLRAEGNRLMDAGVRDDDPRLVEIVRQIRDLETRLHMTPADWERNAQVAEQLTKNINAEIDSIDARIADAEARLDALSPETPAVTTTPSGRRPPPTDSPTDTSGKKPRDPDEILAELGVARDSAYEKARAQQETLQAQLQATQRDIQATEAAFNALIDDAKLPHDDPRVQQMLRDLEELEARAERLQNALRPRQLAVTPTAEVEAATRDAIRVIDTLDARLADVQSRRDAGRITDADAIREELEATEEALDDLSALYSRLAPEHQEYYRNLERHARSLAVEVRRIEHAEAGAALAAQRRAEQQLALGDDSAVGPGRFDTIEDQRAWIEGVRERQRAEREAAARARNERLVRRREAQELAQEARMLGFTVSDAVREGSEEGLRELEALLVERLTELGDDPRAAPFMGLLTRVRSELARIAAEVVEAERRAAEYSAFTRDPVRRAAMRDAEVEGPSAGMATGYSNLEALAQDFPALQRQRILRQLAEDLDFADLKAEALGDSMGGTSEKLRLVQTAIVALLQSGLTPSSEQVARLIADAEKYQAALDALVESDARQRRFAEAVAYARDVLGELPGPLESNIATLTEYRDSLDMSEEGAEELADELDRLIAALERLQALEASPLKELAGNLGNLSNVTSGLGRTFTRSTATVAEGLRLIADEDQRLEGVAHIIRGVAEAVEGLSDAAKQGGLDGNEIMELVGGVASTAAEIVGTLTGIPGLGQVAAASFGLLKAVIGDLSDGLADIRAQVDETARSSRYLGRDILQGFADEYTRRVSRGGIAGSFGATKAELDQEAYDAAVALAESFASTIASAMSATNWEEELDLGFDRMIRDQIVEAFILSPEIQALIQEMVAFWNEAWADGTFSEDEQRRWEEMRRRLLEAGRLTREQLADMGLLDDENSPNVPKSTGSRITDLTGPARDHFADLLAPLRHLGAQLATLQDIRNILDARLGHGVAPAGATAAGGVTITGPITITPATDRFDARALFDELSRIAQRRQRGQ